jgi:hypothetical protein
VFQFTEKKLSKLVIRELQIVEPGINTTYDANNSEVNYGDNGNIYLGNIFNIIKELPRKDRAQYVKKFIQETRSTDTELDANDLLQTVVPRLRTTAGISIRDIHCKRLGNLEKLDVPTSEFANPLRIELVIDNENTVSSVLGEDLKKADLSFEEALNYAVANLARCSDNTFELVYPGTYYSQFNDDFDSARMMLTDAINALEINGQPVAFIPSHKTLWITGSFDSESINKLAQLAQQEIQEVRKLCLVPFVLDGEIWSLFKGEDEATKGVIDELEKIELTTDYDEQKDLLEKLNEKNNQDVFVASHSLYRNEDDGLFSASTWSEGVFTWLPETNLVAFVKDTENDTEMLGTATWERVKEVLGNKLIPLDDMLPVRYEVTTFPSELELQNLNLT